MMRHEFHSLDKMDEYEKWLMKLMHFDESEKIDDVHPLWM
jgi:hypothetical protein